MYSEKFKLHECQKLFKPGNLRTLVIDVTPKCNMHCPHCYADTFSKVEPIDLSILKTALDEASEMGAFHFVLMGGEPILDSERLEEIVKFCRPEESFLNVVSNGWNMTLDTIHWLKKLGIDKITMSLDSGIEEEHDSNRKPDSYKRVIEAVDNVLKEDLMASISTIITHQSLYSQGFSKAYEYACKKNIRMDIQIAMPVGKWDGNKDFLITSEDAKYLKQLNIKSESISNGHKIINRDIYSHYLDYDYCPAGTEFLSISADGQLLPCNFLQFSLGNIKNKSISEMRNDLLTNQWFKANHPVCLCGEDHTFIDTFMTPHINDKKPLNAYKVFNLGRGI